MGPRQAATGPAGVADTIAQQQAGTAVDDLLAIHPAIDECVHSGKVKPDLPLLLQGHMGPFIDTGIYGDFRTLYFGNMCRDLVDGFGS